MKGILYKTNKESLQKGGLLNMAQDNIFLVFHIVLEIQGYLT